MSKPLVASVDARKMLSEAKFFESYSRFIDAKQRFETWDESVERVMQMHKEKYLINNPLNLDVKDYLELQESIDFAEGYYKQKKVLGAQRALQFGGEQLLKHNIRLYNCVSSYCDRPQFFGEFMYMLLCGAGAGFSVQWHHIAKLPRLTKRTGETVTFEVQDSIEGWAEAFDVLLSSFFVGGGKHPEYEGKKIHFDLTNIRLKGSLIAGHFKAPGPEPLRKALDLTEALIKKNIAKYTMDENGHIRMNPIDYYDICMYMADAVISGGVRRSATICLFSKDDEEMVKAKTGDWYISNPQRGRSNNSAVLVRGEVSFEEFQQIMVSVQHSGEPGFIFTDDRDFTYNPCVEIGKYPQTEDGRTGWQGCNLCEMNGSMVTSREEFINMARAASILGTLQAGYTDFKFLESSAKEIFEKESLIGISITGWMNSPSILFDKQNMIDAAEEVKAVNKRIASLIKINPAARTTCVKPSGNASVLLATANGIHGEHSKKYIRHVQLNKESEVAQILSKINPDMMEESAWSANGTDYCVAFPIVPPEGSIYKKDLLGVKQLDYVKLAQEYWVEYGTNEDLCVKKGLRHNVSNTITVDDWDEVTEYVYKNRYSFCGISFLAASGDKAYMQAPNAEVLDMQEIVDKYGEASLLCSALIEAGLNAFNTNLWNACSTAMGYGEDISTAKHENAMKRDWVRRFDKFTTNFITGEYSEADKEAHLFGTESMVNLYSELDKLKLGKESVIALNCLDAEDLVLFSDTVDAKIVKIIEEIQNFKDILATNKYTKALADSRQICSDCLKDVYYFHKWWKIEKAIKHIDWAEVLKTKVLTDIDTMAAVACAGGKCEI